MFRTHCPYCRNKIERLANAAGKVDREESLILKPKFCPSCQGRIKINIWFPIFFCFHLLAFFISFQFRIRCDLPFELGAVNPLVIVGVSFLILSLVIKTYKKAESGGKTT